MKKTASFRTSINGGLPARIIVIILLSVMIVLLVAAGSPVNGMAGFAFTLGDWRVSELAVGTPPGGGDAVMLWTGKKDDLQANNGLYAQKVDKNGNTMWDWNLTLAEPAGNVSDPLIVVRADGSAVVTWMDDRTGNLKTYMQVITPSGQTLWTANGVAISTDDTKEANMTLVSGLQGEVVVTWENYNPVTTMYDVRVQRIDAGGNREWGDDGKTVSTSPYDNRGDPSLVSDGQGGAVVAWHNQTGTASDIWAQRLDANGTRMWGDGGLAISKANRCQLKPTVIMTPGGWVTVWKDQRDASHSQVYAQKTDANGNNKWAENGVPVASDSKVNFEEPKPAVIQGSGLAASIDVPLFCIVSPTDDPSGQGVYAQVLDTDTGQSVLTAPVQVQTPKAGVIKDLVSAPDSSGGGFPAWSYTGPDGKTRVYYTKMNADGSFAYYQPQSVEVPNTTGQVNPAISSGGQDSAILTWVNYQQGSDKGQGYGLWMGDLMPDTYYFSEGTSQPGFQTYFTMGNFGVMQRNASMSSIYNGTSVEAPTVEIPMDNRQTVNANANVDPGTDFGTTVDISTQNGASAQAGGASAKVMTESPFYFNNDFGDGAPISGGTVVVGARAPRDTWYFAEGTTRPGFITFYTILNSGTSAVDVDVNFYRGDGQTETTKVPVEPESRYTINAKDLLGVGDDAAHDFSSEFTATGDVTVQRSVYTNRGDWNGGHGVMGAGSLGTSFYFAEGTVRPGFDTFFLLSNTGSEAADVSIELARGDGTTFDHDVTLGANSRQTVTVSDLIGSSESAASDFAAKVTSTNGVAFQAERSMYWNRFFGDLNVQNTGCHDVIGAGALANTWYFAEGTSRPGFVTYYTLANFSDTQITVNCQFIRGEGEPFENEVVLEPNTRKTVNVNELLGSGDSLAFDYSGKIQSLDGVPIGVERSVYFFKSFDNVANCLGGHATAGISE